MTTPEKLGPYWVKDYQITVPPIPYRLLVFADVGAVNVDPPLGSAPAFSYVYPATEDLNQIVEYYNGGPEEGGAVGPVWGISFPAGWYKSVSTYCNVVAAPSNSFTLNVSAVTAGASINSFYNGGSDSLGGNNPNYNFGIAFSANAQAVQVSTNSIANTASANVLGFAAGSPASLTKSTGFTSQLSFKYSCAVTTTVTVNGASGVITTYVIPVNSSLGCEGAAYCNWDQATIDFVGTATSVVFTGGYTSTLIDDMVLGKPLVTPVTEPYNGLGQFYGSPTNCVTACPPATATVAYINVPDGFVGRWSVWTGYSGANNTYPTVILYSGLNGTGVQLTSGNLAIGTFGNVSSYAFYQTIITFAGVAKSVAIYPYGGGTFNNQFFFSNMEFGVPPALTEAPILTFDQPITPYSNTVYNWESTGNKVGIGFEELFTPPVGSPPYAPISVGSYYNSLYSLTFVNATAVLSNSAGGTGQFNVRTLNTPTGPALALGNTAVQVTPGQSMLIINAANGRDFFSCYYASASPVIVKAWSSPNATGLVGQMTVPATGTCSLPDVTNVYCAWGVLSLQSAGAYQSISLQSADPNALFDNITINYPAPVDMLLPAPDPCHVGNYYNGGSDSTGNVGPAVPVGPPYPTIYGNTFSSNDTPLGSGPGYEWLRLYFAGGPSLSDGSLANNGNYLGGYYLSPYGFYSLATNGTGYVNSLGGFTQQCSFFMINAGFLNSVFIGIFSGLNGTGASIPYTKVTSNSSGYQLYTFDGWARSLKFSGGGGTIIAGVQLGYRTANPVLPYLVVPGSTAAGVATGQIGETGGNFAYNQAALSFNPDGSIWALAPNGAVGNVSYVQDHWLRNVQPAVTTGAVLLFSFDGLANGQTSFSNIGTLGGAWASPSASVAASTVTSKFGTSALLVTADPTEPAFELFWPGITDLVAPDRTIEGHVYPRTGTSLPFGKTLLMCWDNTAFKGAEWNIQNSWGSKGVFIYGSDAGSGQTLIQACIGQVQLGQVLVATNAWHHVAVTISNSGTVGTLLVDGALIGAATNSASVDSIGCSRIVFGQADRLGTFSYLLSECRVTVGSLLYTGAYTVPSAPFTAQAVQTLPGQNLWLQATLEASEAGELVDSTLTPYNYIGPALNQWHRLDVPLQFKLPPNNTIELKFKLATDSAGANVVSTSLPRGAQLIGYTKPDQVGFTGNSLLVNQPYINLVNGGIEPYYEYISTQTNQFGGAVSAAFNKLTKALTNWRVEPFESLPLGATSSLTTYFHTNTSRLSCTIAAATLSVVTSTIHQANISPSGTKWLSLSGTTTFTFSAPVTGFGMHILNPLNGGGFLNLQLTDTAGVVYTVQCPITTSQAASGVNFIGFHHPGRQYTSVALLAANGTFGPIGVDDIIVATRDQLNEWVLTAQDGFLAQTGSLADSVPTNGNTWVEAFPGANSLTNIKLGSVTFSGSTNSTAFIATGAYGPTRYGAVLSNPAGPNVMLALGKITNPLTASWTSLGMEWGIIARKNGNNYYHLTYTLYPVGTLPLTNTFDNQNATYVITLTHYPSGTVLLGPLVYTATVTGITYTLIGNAHTIVVNVTGTQTVTIFDNRILTGGQNGFTLKQLTA